MMRSPLIKTIWVLFAALFFTVQGLSQVHAIENGGDDHSHDGVICDVSLAAAQQNIDAPSPSLTTPFVPPTEANWDILILNSAPQAFYSRAPPPRGPPTH